MKIFIGCDHRGVNLKKEIIARLHEDGIDLIDTVLQNSADDAYPDFAFEVGENVIKNPGSLGILICGNGIGISIAANKVKGIICARALTTDDAFKSKNHNGANVLAIGANLGIALAKEIVDTFIETDPASIPRYLKRIDSIIKYENGEYNEL